MLTEHAAGISLKRIKRQHPKAPHHPDGDQIVERPACIEHHDQFSVRLQYTVYFALGCQNVRYVMQYAVTEHDIKAAPLIRNVLHRALLDCLMGKLTQ